MPIPRFVVLGYPIIVIANRSNELPASLPKRSDRIT